MEYWRYPFALWSSDKLLVDANTVVISLSVSKILSHGMITTLVLQLWNLLFGNDMLYNTTFRKLTKIWDHNGQYHLILWQDQSKTSLTTDYFNTCTSHNFAKFLDFIAERDQKLAQVGNHSQIATVMTWEPGCSNFSQCEWDSSLKVSPAI